MRPSRRWGTRPFRFLTQRAAGSRAGFEAPSIRRYVRHGQHRKDIGDMMLMYSSTEKDWGYARMAAGINIAKLKAIAKLTDRYQKQLSRLKVEGIQTECIEQ